MIEAHFILWQEELYPGKTWAETYWGKRGKEWIQAHSILGRVVLLPVACFDAMLELIKKVACAFSEAREGIKMIWGSFYNDRKTVRKGFTLFEESLSHVVKIPMIPIRFAWQLICILKNKPCEITPLHCEN